MTKSLLNLIFEDLDKHFTVCAFKSDCAHFEVGLYIRNQYLWSNESNVKILSEYFKTQSIDGLSHCIMDEYLKNKH